MEQIRKPNNMTRIHHTSIGCITQMENHQNLAVHPVVPPAVHPAVHPAVAAAVVAGKNNSTPSWYIKKVQLIKNVVIKIKKNVK